jgi:hypothetical protein
MQWGPLVMCASSSLYAQLGITAPQHPRWAWNNPLAPTLALHARTHTRTPPAAFGCAASPTTPSSTHTTFHTHTLPYTHTYTQTLPAAFGCTATLLVDATLRLASLPRLPHLSGVCLPVCRGTVLTGWPEHGGVHALPCRHLWRLHSPHHGGLLRPLRRGVRALDDRHPPLVAAHRLLIDCFVLWVVLLHVATGMPAPLAQPTAPPQPAPPASTAWLVPGCAPTALRAPTGRQPRWRWPPAPPPAPRACTEPRLASQRQLAPGPAPLGTLHICCVVADVDGAYTCFSFPPIAGGPGTFARRAPPLPPPPSAVQGGTARLAPAPAPTVLRACSAVPLA